MKKEKLKIEQENFELEKNKLKKEREQLEFEKIQLQFQWDILKKGRIVEKNS